MRIAFVSPGYPPTVGGVELVVAQIGQALTRAGHTVEVFAQERRADLVGVGDDGEVVVHRYPCAGPHDYPVAPSLWRSLAAQTAMFDVVHGHSYHTLTGLAAALRSRAPFVFSPHYHGTGHSPLRAALHRVYKPVGGIAFGRARSVVCVSRAEAQLVAAHFPSVADRITVVPNGVDAAAIGRAEPIEGEPPTVLSIGRLERYKRIDRLIEVFAALPSGARAQLVVLGDEPDRSRLEALAARSGGSVRFLGRVDDGELHRWLRTCSVLCSLSEHEAFGLAPAEALTAGAAVLVSDIPAHRELAAMGPVQLVDADETASGLAERLLAALSTSSGERSRLVLERPLGVPDWDEIADRLAELYRNVVPNRSGVLS